MGWTEAQKKVIDSRGKNLLVSAAAGSGKTAVMVERIIELVSDENHPVDIDKLLVVTFTNAAASEMKERIMNALEKKVQKDPDNQHLLRQIARVQKAQITTIHSFCLNLIREYFMEVDLDPGFRIAEEGEVSLLEKDALEEVLEEAYEQGHDGFFDFIESYSTGKSDRKIEDIILKAYKFARSGTRPEKWLDDAKQIFYSDPDTLFEQSWTKYLMKDISYDVDAILDIYDRIYKAVQDPKIPDGHRKAVMEEYERIQHFRDAGTLKDYIEAASFWKTSPVRGRAGKNHDKKKTKQIMDLRKIAHERIHRLLERKLPSDSRSVVREMEQCRESMTAFTDLVQRFMEVVQRKKKEKNMVDFSDLEQYALKILVAGYDDEGNPVPSKIAYEKKKYYTEIYVDEYQDTNEIQEEIIRMISGESEGKYNLFTVGDVKQSIYGFRQAKPELFTRRFYRYQETSEKHELIELQNNFRSRKEVLNTTNYFFYRLMIRELGGIDYNEKTALVPSMEFSEEQTGMETELHMLNVDDPISGITDVEAEAIMIGHRILEITDENNGRMVTVTKEDGTKGLRRAEFRDIVILLRTVSGWGETFQEQLERMGIPAFCESKKGSFSTIEVQTVMSILKVLDNEQQDISFAAFLRAPFIGLTGEDMVWMTSLKETEPGQRISMSDHMRYYLEHGNRKELLQKLRKADEFLREFRRKKQYLLISDLIWDILKSTGYYHIIGAMPYGERRQANVRMLIQKAAQYENGSYKGLFYFVRYMEQLKEYDIDYGEANIQGEHENLVRIMSIHKSKGLEYPVVILAGLSKHFNFMDSRTPILMHSDYHLGPDAISPETREKHPTLLKKMISLKIQEETISEEMRILYVAMTRAKEKLIMTGTIKKLADQLAKNYEENEGQSYFKIKNATSYMDWVLMVLARHPSMKSINQTYFPARQISYEEADESELKIQIISMETLAEREVEKQKQAGQKKQELYHEMLCYDEQESLHQLEFELHWKYPYAQECEYQIKYSVSEIKRRSQKDLEEEGVFQTITSEDPEPLIPDFMKKEQAITPAGRGTVVHKCMELLDFTKEYTKEELDRDISLWIKQGKIEAENEPVIPKQQILWFLKSKIGKRTRNAARNGKVYKEKQFTVGLSFRELEPGSDSEELAVIQGVIDLYFEEEEELVLIDYKTDRVFRGEEQVLIDHYQEQIKCYKKALEQMTGKRVKESYITSLTLRENIAL